MDNAAQTLASWDKSIGEKLPLYVGVNLSAIQAESATAEAIAAPSAPRRGNLGQPAAGVSRSASEFPRPRQQWMKLPDLSVLAAARRKAHLLNAGV